MAVTLNSTKAKVRNPEKVREILASYECEGVEINLQGEVSEWTLEMAYHDGDWEFWEWPGALRPEQLPSEEQYDDEDDFYDAEQEVFMEKGREGFLALLRELAAHLESPLLILCSAASPYCGLDYGAEVWRVQPGSQEVETLEV